MNNLTEWGFHNSCQGSYLGLSCKITARLWQAVTCTTQRSAISPAGGKNKTCDSKCFCFSFWVSQAYHASFAFLTETGYEINYVKTICVSKTDSCRKNTTFYLFKNQKKKIIQRIIKKKHRIINNTLAEAYARNIIIAHTLLHANANVSQLPPPALLDKMIWRLSPVLKGVTRFYRRWKDWINLINCSGSNTQTHTL